MQSRASPLARSWAPLYQESSTAMLNGVLKKLIQRGRLTVIYADGSQHSFGERERGEPDIVVRLTTPKAPWLIALHPDRYLGEAYVDGHLLIEQGDLWDPRAHQESPSAKGQF
jgi:hypothetical protein